MGKFSIDMESYLQLYREVRLSTVYNILSEALEDFREISREAEIVAREIMEHCVETVDVEFIYERLLALQNLVCMSQKVGDSLNGCKLRNAIENIAYFIKHRQIIRNDGSVNWI